MNYRRATEADVPLLAEWNHQLVRDEGHRNQMTVPELAERMNGWLAGEYVAILFEGDLKPVAYALYLDEPDEVYLRHLFVVRERRRGGIGRKAVELLQPEIWPKTKRLTVEVLIRNEPAVAFWRSVGYQDYCLTLELLPNERRDS